MVGAGRWALVVARRGELGWTIAWELVETRFVARSESNVVAVVVSQGMGSGKAKTSLSTCREGIERQSITTDGECRGGSLSLRKS